MTTTSAPRAIVTGATGFLGSHLVMLLEEQGYQVIALGRNADKGQKLNSEQTTFKATDITNKSTLLQSFEQVDVVFHCAALSSAWGKMDDFERVNVQGARYVLQCCEQYEVKKLVYVSSTSVYFDFKDKTNIAETEVLQHGFVNHYAQTKYQAEQCLLTEKENTEVVIIRPRGIVGDGDTSIMPRVLRIADKGFFPLINQGKAIVDLTYVKNVAYALLLAAEKTGINGHCFNISNMEPLTVKSLLQKVLNHRKSSSPCRFFPMPYLLIYGIAYCLEGIAKCFSLGEPALTCYGVGLLAKTQTLNIEAARDELGYTPLYNLDHAIEQYVKWEERA